MWEGLKGKHVTDLQLHRNTLSLEQRKVTSWAVIQVASSSVQLPWERVYFLSELRKTFPLFWRLEAFPLLEYFLETLGKQTFLCTALLCQRAYQLHRRQTYCLIALCNGPGGRWSPDQGLQGQIGDPGTTANGFKNNNRLIQ